MEAGTFPRELLISGPAGTGKTRPIVTLIHKLCKYEPLRVLFLRETRASLTESVLTTYEEEIVSKDRGQSYLLAGASRSTRKLYEYRSGARIVPAGLDRSLDRVLSTAWDIVFYNEASQARPDVWETISSRMDRPGRSSRFGWLVGDMNPSAPDFFLLKRAAEGKTEHWETTHRANPAMWDGRDWTEAGERYLARLRDLTGIRRKRFLQGLWVAGEGTWFDTYDPTVHEQPIAHDPNLPLYCSVDSGNHSAAVLFQVVEAGTKIHVLADYLAETRLVSLVAADLNELCRAIAPGYHHRVVSTDSSGDSKNAMGGPVVTAEYLRAGLCNRDGDLLRWPKYPGCVNDGLNLIGEFMGGDGVPPRLAIHPRCKTLRAAFQSYQRARRGGQWQDYPEDPQHPHEDVIDALRGGLRIAFPEGRKPEREYHARVNFRRVI